MSGIEYMNSVCPTTKNGRDPNREDVADAFEDGIAEGWKQCEEKQWKPSEEQMKVLDAVIDEYNGYPEFDSLVSLKNDLNKLKEE